MSKIEKQVVKNRMSRTLTSRGEEYGLNFSDFSFASLPSSKELWLIELHTIMSAVACDIVGFRQSHEANDRRVCKGYYCQAGEQALSTYGDKALLPMCILYASEHWKAFSYYDFLLEM